MSVWSNFEIGDLDFWRGEAYSKFFDYLDEQGGFYYEVSLVFVCRDPDSPGRNSVGEMHQFIVSVLHCSRGRIRFTSSMTSDIDTIPTRTVRRETCTKRDDVGAMSIKVLVSISVHC